MSEGKDNTKKDLENSLKRAFVDKGLPSILMDGHVAKSEFLRDALNHGLNQGWLQKKEDIKESQYTAMTYTLTNEGKKYFGLK